MKHFQKWLRLGAFLFINAAFAIVFYLVIDVIFLLEEVADGDIPVFNFTDTLVDAFTSHWHSMIITTLVMLIFALVFRRYLTELREREQVLKGIVETAANGIYMVDRSGHITFANAAAERIMGVERGQLAQRTYDAATWKTTTLDGQPFPEAEQPFTRVMNTGQLVSDVEQSFEQPDGKRVSVSINAAPLRDEEGNLIGEVSAMTDITERKRAETALRQAEKRYRQVFEGVSVMNVLTRHCPDGPEIIDCNELFARTLGYTREEILGRPSSDFYTADSCRRMLEGGYDRALHGKLLTEERELLAKDGRIINVLVAAVPDTDESGRSVGTQAQFVDITERKRAEAALRQAEKRYRQVFEGVSVMNVLTRHHPDGPVIIDCNELFARTLGYTRSEILGRPSSDFYTPESCRRMLEGGYHRALRGELLTEERELLAKDGRIINVLVAAVPDTDENGQSVGTQAQFVDITERKRTEQALAESEEQFRSIFETASDAVVLADREGTVVGWNPGAEKIFQYTAQEVMGKSLMILMPARYQDSHSKGMRETPGATLENFGDKTMELSGLRKDGSEFPLEISICHWDGTKGKSYGAIIRDVTERRRTMEALRQSESKNRALVEAIPDSLFQISRDGILLEYKAPKDRQAFLRYTEHVGKKMADVTPPEIMEKIGHHLDHVVQSGESRIFEYQLKINQEVYDREARLVPNGEDEALMIVRDITDRKRVDRLKNEFISVVSHELRTPLTSIRGSLGLIAGGAAGHVSRQAKSLVDIAYKNSERLIRLINDMLDIEKIELGKMAFDLKPIDLLPLLTQTVEANRAYGKQFGVEFVFEKELPSLQVNADPDRLIQVVTNLLSNAAKFSPQGSTVELNVSRCDSRVRVSVHDHGPGIPEQFRSSIFQKFAQADSSNTRQKGGTGLGLSICKAIVERLGGQIGFETSPNAGTTFYFDLPEWHDPVQALPPVTPRKPRVLICEDDHDTAMLLKLMLEQSGYVPEVAYGAAQAKEMLQQNDYAGMTLDLVLPDEDGISLIRELRNQEKTRDLSIVVVSMKAEKGRSELNGDAVQVIDWISKPIDPSRLLAAVDQAVSRTQHRPAHILHVDDDSDILQVVSAILHDVAQVDGATTCNAARQLLSEKKYDLVILDLEMPDGSGVDLIPLLGEHEPSVPAVIFSVEEAKKEMAEKVSATLVKSRTSNEKLVQTIHSLIHPLSGIADSRV